MLKFTVYAREIKWLIVSLIDSNPPPYPYAIPPLPHTRHGRFNRFLSVPQTP